AGRGLASHLPCDRGRLRGPVAAGRRGTLRLARLVQRRGAVLGGAGAHAHLAGPAAPATRPGAESAARRGVDAAPERRANCLTTLKLRRKLLPLCPTRVWHARDCTSGRETGCSWPPPWRRSRPGTGCCTRARRRPRRFYSCWGTAFSFR